MRWSRDHVHLGREVRAQVVHHDVNLASTYLHSDRLHKLESGYDQARALGASRPRIAPPRPQIG